ncbi:hypothetical protein CAUPRSCDRAFT_11255 [Caulochytrium protostelioides]|uniref:RNI-like protein n=1 Tax=Caulochytrium protostelioides TaxID=1555241 RepID=A0A4P9X092_9FUNG|nr:hypothetical protein CAUPRSCDRAFT_11255 [Caulochytrium protostelioides]
MAIAGVCARWRSLILNPVFAVSEDHDGCDYDANDASHMNRDIGHQTDAVSRRTVIESLEVLSTLGLWSQASLTITSPHDFGFQLIQTPTVARRLRRLVCQSGDLLGDGERMHGCLVALPALTSLDLSRTVISDAVLTMLPAWCPGLRALNLTSCTGITTDGLMALAPLGKNTLELLDVSRSAALPAKTELSNPAGNARAKFDLTNWSALRVLRAKHLPHLSTRAVAPLVATLTYVATYPSSRDHF